MTWSPDLDGSPYQGYLYGYPHKTAYRPLRPRPALREVWADERQDDLFLYLHLPFCEMRCGFCNLFTRANPPAEQVSAYLTQLGRQAARVRDGLDPAATVARVAIGGGTPTYLTAAELTGLFDLVDGFGVRAGAVPMSVETSPATATADRIGVLAERGVTRISMGVQSFLDAEAHAAGRPQRRPDVERALDTIRAHTGPELNLDLIYGIPGQTARTWAESLTAALRWRPEEIFLYPLYVRPLTGLGRRTPPPALGRREPTPALGRREPTHLADQRAPQLIEPGGTERDERWDAQRLELYRQGRAALLAAGYQQLSMRQFRLAHLSVPAGDGYRCQDDGMVGLGCGARSYTGALHYSFDYAVSVGGVRAIIDDYLRRPAADFDVAEVGFRLDAVEQRRRWLVISLLRAEGFDPADYQGRFGIPVEQDFPQLDALVERGWLVRSQPDPLRSQPDPRSPGSAARLALTPAGLERSDAIGPWLVSGPVRAAMLGYALR